MPDANAAEASKPKLVGVPGGGEERARRASRWSAAIGSSGRLFGLAAALLLLAVVTLGVQTRRVEKLAGEVQVLQTQLVDANRQLDVYQTQLDLVRDSLEGILEQLTALHEAVSEAPLGDPEPPEAP